MVIMMSRFIHIDIKEIKDEIINGRRVGKQEINFLMGYTAKILDLIGEELYEAINANLENTIIFKVRYCTPMEKLRDKKNFIIYWNNRKYEIYYVDFMAYKRNYIKIKCNEVL